MAVGHQTRQFGFGHNSRAAARTVPQFTKPQTYVARAVHRRASRSNYCQLVIVVTNLYRTPHEKLFCFPIQRLGDAAPSRRVSFNRYFPRKNTGCGRSRTVRDIFSAKLTRERLRASGNRWRSVYIDPVKAQADAPGPFLSSGPQGQENG